MNGPHKGHGFPKALEQMYLSWRELGTFPKILPKELEQRRMFNGTQFQHLFVGMVFYTFEMFQFAAPHFRTAVLKDESALAHCTEMIVFHRVSTRLFKKNLFDVIDTDDFLEVMSQHFKDTHRGQLDLKISPS